MCKSSFRLSVAFLFLSTLPLGCTSSSDSPKGSGGTGSGGSHAGGTSGASSGGSGGTSSATGGKSGSGGSSAGGTSGGTGGGETGGSSGGSGGDATGGSGGDETGGGGGSQPGGAGGMATGGSGGTSPSDGRADGKGGNSGDAREDGGRDASDDGTAVNDDTGGGDTGGTCTDKVQSDLETDVDCGGGTCPKCGAGLKCKTNDDCRSGTCESSGKCTDPFAATATVTNNNGSNMWTITLGTVILQLDSSSTGMVASLTIDGTDLVVKNSASNGSVFWISPQNAWYTDGTTTWPPPSEMYSAAYTPSSKDNILTMTGPVGSTDKISIIKRYWGNVDHQAVTLEYTIHNGNSTAVSKAPWEITRVYPGGLTFFPNADAWVKQGDSSFNMMPVTTSQGAVWFNDPYNVSNGTANVKGGVDGLEGWAAHIACGTGLGSDTSIYPKCTTSPILIKQWTDTPASNETVNSSEREIELYSDQSNTYVEFEQQGLYQSIPANGDLVWTMHWLIRYLPSTVAPTSGSADLLTWVRGQLL